MLRHAARSVPWTLVGAASLLMLVLLGAVRLDPWRLWPLEGTAVGLLAATVGWCLDEPAAAVVDAAPRGLAWRTTARVAGIAVPVAAWAGGVLWAGDSLHDHPVEVLVQGLSAVMVAGAWVTWRRARGEAVPGRRWASAVVPLVTAWALVRPLQDKLPVFPYAAGGPYGDWETSRQGWSVAALLAGLTLVLTLSVRRRVAGSGDG